MDINRMKLGLVYIFSEATTIRKRSKIQLINFIEQASEHQIKVLALDGEIIPEQELDDASRKIIDARFITQDNIKESLKAASIKALKKLSEK